MPQTVLNLDEQSLLRDIRDQGSISLTPEMRNFEDAERLLANGLVRAVRTRGYPASTYLLSGDGVAAAGRWSTGPSTRN